MTDNVATVSLMAIERVIGLIPMEETDAALRQTFAL
jgi:hypothetical protein